MTHEIEIPVEEKIYCNRSLNMSHILAVGFDMDYTLAVYKPSLEALAYQQTLQKLVNLGYPSEILQWQFDWNYMVRGLVIDKLRGNIIKMDRHRYVKVAYHGFERLPRDHRRGVYASDTKNSYEEPEFAVIDTLFGLADGYLFSQLVELKDKLGSALPNSYPQIYKDVRMAIDLCHRDGSIKTIVSKNPRDFVVFDPNLRMSLESIKASGKKLFLATNSLWAFTNTIMSFLFGQTPDTPDPDWHEMFDVVITGAAKPGFFNYNAPIYEVTQSDGLLKNTELINKQNKIYQGGNYKDLHSFLEISSGSQVLYVGDHIYGDILRSKKELGWRTMLVIQELAPEIKKLKEFENTRLNYENDFEKKELIEKKIQKIIKDLRNNSLIAETAESIEMEEDLKNQLLMLLKDKEVLREDLRVLMKSYHAQFHPTWGQLMKTGHQNSRFAAQVESYACLYTSKVTNLRYYHPNHSFRSTRDLMPHDF